MSHALRFALAFGLALALAAPLFADTCQGCGGSGRIGCGGCNSFPGVGICQKCTGNGSYYDSLEKRQVNCPSCHGTGKCAGCGGQGAACMVCQGTGQTQGGGGGQGNDTPREAPGGRPTGGGQTQEQVQAKIVEALQPLGVLVGDWGGSGKLNGLSFQSQGRCASCLNDTFLLIEWTVQFEDGRTESSLDMLTYDPTAKSYTMTVFSSPGQRMQATGVGTQDGNGIAWTIVGNQGVRFTWHMGEDGTWTSEVEANQGQGWKNICTETLRRGEGDEGGGLEGEDE